MINLLDLKHEVEQMFHLQKGTLGRATRVTRYVRARDFFVKKANSYGIPLAEIDRFMGWSHGSASHYLHRE